MDDAMTERRKNISTTRPDAGESRRSAERQAVREQARREIPALRKVVDKNLADLRRIAGTGS